MPEKCCGTCHWSTPLDKDNEHSTPLGIVNRVSCVWEVHHQIPICINTNATPFMYDYEGGHCPCWESK